MRFIRMNQSVSGLTPRPTKNQMAKILPQLQK